MCVIARCAFRVALIVLGAACTLATSIPSALAQSWPQRTVKLIIPLPPGTGTDIAGRLLAEHLAERWGQPVVIENKQGGDGIPAVTAFLSARDTHTLLMSFAGIITINPLTHERLPYDPAADLVPLVQVSDNFIGVAAATSLKVASVADLIRAARAQPGKLNWAATPGLPYYIVLALQQSAAIEMVPVGYRDFAPALQDLTTGRLHVAATGVPPLLPHHQAGTAKILFVTNRERSPQVPEVPTAKEAGYPDLTFEGSIGLFGWRDMPPYVRERIVRDVQAVAADPAFRSRLIAGGTVSRSGTSEEFAATIAEQRKQIAAIHRAFAKPAQ
jgi:tripartite-type tricarboxylate transporter receptor subunit TctC